MNKKIIFVTLLSGLMYSCGTTPAQTEQPAEIKKPVIKISEAKLELVTQEAEFTGTIQPFYKNNISPSLGLRIDKIHVDVGDKVKSGDLLVEMDKRQYLQAAIQLSNLEVDYLRFEKLYEEGGISKQQLDQLQTQMEISKHATDNLRENADLLSPIDGVVTERAYDPGDVYSPTQGRILAVMQLDRVKIQVNVSELYFPNVKVGMPVDIKLDVYPGEVFPGKVSLIYPAFDGSTRTFTAEITIPNGSMRLRPGMFSRVMLNFGKAERILINDVAVQKQIGSNERYVFVLNENNVAIRKVVTVGRVVGNKYEVLSGVNNGEKVVVAGAQKLTDGLEVEVSK